MTLSKQELHHIALVDAMAKKPILNKNEVCLACGQNDAHDVSGRIKISRYMKRTRYLCKNCLDEVKKLNMDVTSFTVIKLSERIESLENKNDT